MLEVRQLTKRYGSHPVLDQLHFTLPTHHLMLLTGTSGSGKTTLLNILNLAIPFSGIVRFEGMDLHRFNAEEKIRFRQHYLGVVYQGKGLMETLTIQDQIQLVKAIKGENESGVIRQAWHQFFQEVSPQQRIQTLSRGQQQRLAVLLAALGRTQILLLDEPTTGLDQQNRQWLYQLLAKLKSSYTIIVSTHQPLTDGLAYDCHLALPAIANNALAVSAKKSLLPPQRIQKKLPISWLIPFHFRYRKLQRYRKRLQAFQSLTFTMLGVMISLFFLIRQEVTHLSLTMLGGQYQWLQPLQQQTSTLKSTVIDDPIIKQYPGKKTFRHYYDESYFETLKPYQRFYVDDDGFQISLKDVHLGLINLYQTPAMAPAPYQQLILEMDEVILGIQLHQLRILSQVLACYPTLTSVNSALSFSPLSLYVAMHVPDWGYQDEYAFTLKAVTLTETAQWFHTDEDYAHLIYEKVLRLPTKGVEEERTEAPWMVSKTVVMQLLDDYQFILDWRDDLAWQHYHLHRHPQLGWRLYRQNQPRQSTPAIAQFPSTFHYHSDAGYHYYPSQNLSGFANPIFFHPEPEGNEIYLQTLKALSTPYAWLDVIGPEASSIGYILANPGTTIKHQTIVHPSLGRDEIIVSSALLSMWQLAIGDRVDTTIAPQYLHDTFGVIDRTFSTSLKIVGTRPEQGLWLYQQPHWLAHWLMMEAFIPSALLMPQAWITYEAIRIPNHFESVNPLAQVQAVIKDIEGILFWIMMGFMGFMGIPLLILFTYFVFQTLTADRLNLQHLRGFGAPWSMVAQWYQTKTGLLMGEALLSSFLLVIGLDALVTRWIRQYFYLPYGYQFPLLAVSTMLLVISGFYLFIMLMELWTLKKEYKLNHH